MSVETIDKASLDPKTLRKILRIDSSTKNWKVKAILD
jgi:hypothetical protein